jgi:peptidyl-prolyl cis-trans isomerase B (cyclophilin B)
MAEPTMSTEHLEGNEYPRGPLIPPQVLVLLLLLIAIPVVAILVNRPQPPAETDASSSDSLYANEQKADSMNSRRAEVDKALESVDFEKNTYQIQFETTLGEITLDLYPDVAPGHCRNIIGLTKIGFYDGIIFHRVISGFVCQAGCPQGTGTGGPGYQIKAEFNDKPHVAGTLSMARSQSPDSGGSQFFICLGRVPNLDKQYTVFGQTADDDSLATVMKFNSIRTGPSDRPVEEVSIKSAKVIETAKK